MLALYVAHLDEKISYVLLLSTQSLQFSFKSIAQNTIASHYGSLESLSSNYTANSIHLYIPFIHIKHIAHTQTFLDALSANLSKRTHNITPVVLICAYQYCVIAIHSSTSQQFQECGTQHLISQWSFVTCGDRYCDCCDA